MPSPLIQLKYGPSSPRSPLLQRIAIGCLPPRGYAHILGYASGPTARNAQKSNNQNNINGEVQW
jgi:hypothetical protein